MVKLDQKPGWITILNTKKCLILIITHCDEFCRIYKMCIKKVHLDLVLTHLSRQNERDKPAWPVAHVQALGSWNLQVWGGLYLTVHPDREPAGNERNRKTCHYEHSIEMKLPKWAEGLWPALWLLSGGPAHVQESHRYLTPPPDQKWILRGCLILPLAQ